jgi:CheY-like chemotaxis protein
MAKVAVPIFRSRVAPVFDYCVRVSVFDIGDDRQIERNELYLGTLSPTERVGALIKEGVTTLICGGMSDSLDKMLQTSSISVIGGIAGQVEEVLEAFMSNRIDEPQYCMPGIGEEKRAPYQPPQERPERGPHVGSVDTTTLSSYGQSIACTNAVSKAKFKVRILLVENDFATQESAFHLLEKSGCEVDTVTNGRDAIKALKSVAYDLVFMDEQIPEMGGYEATKVIRDPQSGILRHDVPVIAIAGNETQEGQKHYIDAGMNDLICKPIEPQRLLDVMKTHLPRLHDSTSKNNA